MKRILIILFLVGFYLCSFSQTFYEDGGEYYYNDYVYFPNLKSVQLYKSGFELSEPIFEIGSNETLLLSFDDLYMGTSPYYYSFELCNSDWTPSDLLPMEYIEGQTEDYFYVGDNSFNTTMPYTHYSLNFPSSNMNIVKAGNYLLKVYYAGEQDYPVITKRFYVLEKKVDVNAKCFVAMSPQYNLTHHELNVKILLKNYSMPNLYDNFSMRIKQNGRKDNLIVKNNPNDIRSEYINFNLPNNILFEAGNEFRVVDIRSLNTQSININKIHFTKDGFQVDQMTDLSRAWTNYLSYKELNGKYSVINWDGASYNDAIEADYAYVEFEFKADSLITNGGMYLIGDFTHWNINNEFLMKYDKYSESYKAKVLLKQGMYNYHYLYVPDNNNTPTVLPFEGNYSETVNEYNIFIYYREQGEYWDKLIGYEKILSE